MTQDDINKWGAGLRKRIADVNLTQGEFADKCNMPLTTLTSYMRDKDLNPKVLHYYKVENTLKMLELNLQ